MPRHATLQIWQALVKAGGAPLGQRELAAHCHANSHLVWPLDFPDTPAGEREAEKVLQDELAQWEKRPPAKRYRERPELLPWSSLVSSADHMTFARRGVASSNASGSYIAVSLILERGGTTPTRGAAISLPFSPSCPIGYVVSSSASFNLSRGRCCCLAYCLAAEVAQLRSKGTPSVIIRNRHSQFEHEATLEEVHPSW